MLCAGFILYDVSCRAFISTLTSNICLCVCVCVCACACACACVSGCRAGPEGCRAAREDDALQRAGRHNKALEVDETSRVDNTRRDETRRDEREVELLCSIDLAFIL